MNSSDYAKSTNSYINDYIKFADAKAGAILTLAGLIGGGIASRIPSTLSPSSTPPPSYVVIIGAILSGVALALAVATAWKCLNALAPKVEPAASLNSFPDIARHTPISYAHEVLHGAGADNAATEYLFHNWTLARIADAKFESIRSAIFYLRLLVLAAAMFGLVLVVSNIVTHV